MNEAGKHIVFALDERLGVWKIYKKRAQYRVSEYTLGRKIPPGVAKTSISPMLPVYLTS